MSSAAITLLNRLKEIERLSRFIEQFGADQGWDIDQTLDVNLILDEVILNVIRHGYDDDAEHQIEVRLAVDKGLLTIQVEDDGRAFNPLDHPLPDLDLPIEERGIGGLGVHIVRTLTESIEHQRVGERNVVTMTKRMGSA